MNSASFPKYLHILHQDEVNGIKLGLYGDLTNNKGHEFISPDKALKTYSNIKNDLSLNQTYVLDNSSGNYILLNEDAEKEFSQNLLFTYKNIFEIMGATYFKCLLKQINSKTVEFDSKGKASFKSVSAEVGYKSGKSIDLSKIISLEEVFYEKVDVDLKKVKKYVDLKGLRNDYNIQSFVERLEYGNKKALKSSYKYSASLTNNLSEAIIASASLTASPLFVANSGFQKKLNEFSEVFCEFEVRF
jgi:hypothetical protein